MIQILYTRKPRCNHIYFIKPIEQFLLVRHNHTKIFLILISISSFVKSLTESCQIGEQHPACFQSLLVHSSTLEVWRVLLKCSGILAEVAGPVDRLFCLNSSTVLGPRDTSMTGAVLPSVAAVTLEPLLARANRKSAVNTKIHDENVRKRLLQRIAITVVARKLEWMTKI